VRRELDRPERRVELGRPGRALPPDNDGGCIALPDARAESRIAEILPPMW
jgi:hypothetical protein